MSLSGTLLALFLLVHMAGNIVILGSSAKFNEYSYALTSNKVLLFAAEGGLIFFTLLHIYMAIQVTLRNRAARPVKYQMKVNTGRSRRWWGSSHMGLTGIGILAFVIYHLIHFKFGAHYDIEQHGVIMRDLAKLVIEEFQQWGQVVLYEVALLVIGMHLFHGTRSIFDTLGLNNSRRDKFLMYVSRAYVVVVFGGFMLIPAMIYFGGVSG